MFAFCDWDEFKILIKKLTHKPKSILFKNSIIYFVASALVGLIPFLLLPIYTRFLSPEDLGVFVMVTTTAMAYLTLITLGQNGVINRFYFDRHKIDFSLILSSSLYTIIGAFFLILIATFIFLPEIKSTSGLNGIWIFIALFLGLLQIPFQIVLGILRVQHKAILFATFQISNVVINQFGGLLLVFFWKNDWIARSYGLLLSSVIMGIGGAVFIVRNGWGRLSFDAEHWKMGMHYGLPLFIHTLGTMLITQADRFLLTSLVDVVAVGLYGVAAQLTAAITMVVEAFNKAYVPWVLEKLTDEQKGIREFLVKVTYRIIFCELILWILFILIVPKIAPLYFGYRFLGSVKFLFWLSLGTLFSAFYSHFVIFIFFTKQTKYLAAGTLLSGFAGVVVGYYLVFYEGAIGAAKGYAIGHFALFVLTWFISQKCYKMPWFRRI